MAAVDVVDQNGRQVVIRAVRKSLGHARRAGKQ
jgi:hypothetical protein